MVEEQSVSQPEASPATESQSGDGELPSEVASTSLDLSPADVEMRLPQVAQTDQPQLESAPETEPVLQLPPPLPGKIDEAPATEPALELPSIASDPVTKTEPVLELPPPLPGKIDEAPATEPALELPSIASDPVPETEPVLELPPSLPREPNDAPVMAVTVTPPLPQDSAEEIHAQAEISTENLDNVVDGVTHADSKPDVELEEQPLDAVEVIEEVEEDEIVHESDEEFIDEEEYEEEGDEDQEPVRGPRMRMSLVEKIRFGVLMLMLAALLFAYGTKFGRELVVWNLKYILQSSARLSGYWSTVISHSIFIGFLVIVIAALVFKLIKSLILGSLPEEVDFVPARLDAVEELDRDSLNHYTVCLEDLGFEAVKDYRLKTDNAANMAGFGRLFMNRELRCYCEVSQVIPHASEPPPMRLAFTTLFNDGWQWRSSDRDVRQYPEMWIMRRSKALWRSLPDESPEEVLADHLRQRQMMIDDADLKLQSDFSVEAYLARERKGSLACKKVIARRNTLVMLLALWWRRRRPRYDWLGDFPRLRKKALKGSGKNKAKSA